MTKDEIIANLLMQLNEANANIRALTEKVNMLTALVQKLQSQLGISEKELHKEENRNKGLTKLLGKENESQKPARELSEKEKKTIEEAKAIKRKARGNNGARRSRHEECKVEYVDLYPTDPGFNKLNASAVNRMEVNGVSCSRTVERYKYIPGYTIKVVYRLHNYSQDGRMFLSATPPSVALNSSYDASFLAGLLQFRYIYGMPVERIIKYFQDNGFDLKKPTADHLLDIASRAFARLYEAIRRAVLSENYIASDETYYKILVPEKNTKGKGVRKGYFWVILGVNSGLLYVVYEDGSRKGDVIYKQVDDYKGYLQSDAASFYKNIEGDAFPNIIRITCLQHIKRKFFDCKNAEPLAAEMVRLINRLYHEEHKHTVGKDGWTVEDNLKWRQEYSPGILKDIRSKLDEILSLPTLLPQSDLAGAADYMDKEWAAIKSIFSRGDTHLDNNLVERINRYFSISRRTSLFFGSHKGAERSAILYTVALSAKKNNLNFFDYVTDVLQKTATWQPNTPLDKYDPLLPNHWRPDEAK